MGVKSWLFGSTEERAGSYDTSLAFNDFVSLLSSFQYAGHIYTLPGTQQEEPTGQFGSMVGAAYKSNGVVFACMLTRMLLFSEARFQFRQLQSGRPGKLFGTGELGILENPWPGGTTGDLLSKAMQHADIAGNAFIARPSADRLVLLRPDWVDIVVGSPSDGKVGAWDVAAEAVGYVYHPGGKNSGKDPVMFLADEVAHFAPIPDPQAMFRGMSWLTPIIREIMADKAMTDHRLALFQNGATVNAAVKMDVDDVEKMRTWIEMFKRQHEGAANSYKTLFLGAGMDYVPVGADMMQTDFKQVQGAGETRIAAAAGVPPVIVGLSEGLQAATYSNYGQARRRFADGTMSPLWRNMAGSLARIINVPSGAELWYDARDIPFLKEDQKDAAEIQGREAATIQALVTAGYEPDSVVAAVVAGDFNLLVHTGLYSVQLQPPITAADAAAALNPGKPQPAIPAKTGMNGNRRMIGELLAALPKQEG